MKVSSPRISFYKQQPYNNHSGGGFPEKKRNAIRFLEFNAPIIGETNKNVNKEVQANYQFSGADLCGSQLPKKKSL